MPREIGYNDKDMGTNETKSPTKNEFEIIAIILAIYIVYFKFRR